jgi:hypothetical protein
MIAAILLAVLLAPVLVYGGIVFQKHFGQLQKLYRQRQEQYRAAYHAAHPTNAPDQSRYGLRVFHRHETVVAQPETSESEHRYREEEFWTWTIRKQRNLNFWTGFAAIAATAAFIVLAVQLSESHRQFELSERPWVSASNFSITDPLKFWGHAGLGIMGVSASLNNSGHSVATNVVFRVFLVAQYGDVKQREREVCAPLSGKDAENASGDVLFPNQPVVKTVSAHGAERN